MRTRFLLGAVVDLKDPLPNEFKGPWRVAGFKANTVPTQYTLSRLRKGMKPEVIGVDEGEIETHTPPRHFPV